MLVHKLVTFAVLLGGSSWAFPRDDSEVEVYFEQLGEAPTQWSVFVDPFDEGPSKDRPEHAHPPIPYPHPPHDPHPPKPPKPPLPPHERPNVENKTIFQALKDDDRFSRLFKLVNWTDTIVSTLNDSSASITFFAPPNKALRPPKHHHHDHHHHHDDDEWQDLFQRAANPSDLLEDIPLLEAFVEAHQLDKDHDHDKKKEIVKKIITAILQYHILPAPLSADELAANTTFATSLSLPDGSLDGEPLRIRVSHVPKIIHAPAIAVNFRSKVIVSDVQAKNGIIHVVDHPVFPPVSSFQGLFLFPKIFSTFTSAIQRVGLGEAIEWRYVPGKDGNKGAVQGSPSNTVFVPINSAFDKIPKKLKFFLFSPFGERVLKKLLQFHIVPEYILHSDWFHNATDSVNFANVDGGTQEALQYARTDTLELPHQLTHPPRPRKAYCTRHCKGKPKHMKGQFFSEADSVDLVEAARESLHFAHAPEPVYAVNLTLPTLLTNHTLYVNIAQYEYRLPLPPHKSTYYKKIVAHGVPVLVPDIPARNGAIHVLDKILNPKKGDHDHDHDEENEWEGWEDWLVKWADEN